MDLVINKKEREFLKVLTNLVPNEYWKRLPVLDDLTNSQFKVLISKLPSKHDDVSLENF
ncbi:MAG: hypothetical protein IPO92_11655 [Saprospiraceae bacterium]|nr:hypothetical protein [Saprospiraceae bacterium]